MYNICGIVKGKESFRKIVLSKEQGQGQLKEILFENDLNEIESHIGFKDLNIIELRFEDERVSSIRKLMQKDSFIQAVIFIENGYLMISDFAFFSAFTRINGIDSPYIQCPDSMVFDSPDDIWYLKEREPGLK